MTGPADRGPASAPATGPAAKRPGAGTAERPRGRAGRSDVLYLRLARADVAMFRFLLEAWDNLALMSSLGLGPDGRETLMLRYAPGAAGEVQRFLAAAQAEMALTLLPRA